MWPDWRDERREGLWRNRQIASLHPEDTSSPPYLWAGTSLHPEDSFSPPWRYLLSTLSVLELLSNVPLIFEDSFSPDLSSLQLVLLSKVWSKSDCDDLISWIWHLLPETALFNLIIWSENMEISLALRQIVLPTQISPKKESNWLLLFVSATIFANIWTCPCL